MSEDRLPESIICISPTPPMSDKLIEQVRHPDELDEATKNLKIPASLLNFHLATPIDLSSMGLGKAVYMPVQITQREGGRQSLYYLNPGDEETLAGIYVTNQGIALRFIRRVSGSSLPAQTGDMYSTRLTNREGEEILRTQEELEIIDPLLGKGMLHLKSHSAIPRITVGPDGPSVSLSFSAIVEPTSFPQ